MRYLDMDTAKKVSKVGLGTWQFGSRELRALNEIAQARGQTLAQMALTWILRDQRVTSALIGASSVAQLEENLRAADGPAFSADELAGIDTHSVKAGIAL